MSNLINMPAKYYIQVLDLPEQEVSAEQFACMERHAGFFPKGQDELIATGGFNARGVHGRIEHVEDFPDNSELISLIDEVTRLRAVAEAAEKRFRNHPGVDYEDEVELRERLKEAGYLK